MKAIDTRNLAEGWIPSFIRTPETPLKIMANGYSAEGPVGGERFPSKGQPNIQRRIGDPRNIKSDEKRVEAKK